MPVESLQDEHTINAWKIAPGKKAWFWENWRNWNCITISWLNETNFLKFKDKDAITEELKKAKEGDFGAAKSIWQFVHEIQEGDIVVANLGKGRVVGIGIVASEYLPPDDPRNPNKTSERHRHVRKVEWLIDKPTEIDEGLFGYRIPPTVLPLSHDQVAEILKAYLLEYPDLKEPIDHIFDRRDGSSPRNEVFEDLEDLSNRNDIKATTKQALIDARLGQGKFRNAVLQQWGQRCAVTSSATEKAIRASHIKPWRDSTNDERLDPNNGLPLIASLDALFDAGLISFEASGRLIVSPGLNVRERQIFGIEKSSLTKPPNARMAAFLAYHRKKHGFKN